MASRKTSLRKEYCFVPELVPSDLWGRSAFRMLKGKAAWTKKIRPDAIAAADGCCEICTNSADPLICHDKWKYDDKTRTATLVGFEVHCRGCDAVTHLGRAVQLGDPDQVLTDAVIKLCEVNGYEPPVAVKVLSDVLGLWTLRSERRWRGC